MKKFFATKNIVYAFIAVILIGITFILICQNNSFERKIGKWIEKNCEENVTWLVRISDIAKFDWDEMYVFHPAYTTSRLEQILGTKVPQNNDAKRKIVFLKNKEIVFYEELKTNIEHYVDKQVVFQQKNQDDDTPFTPETAVFFATKHDGSAGGYYELRSIEQTAD